MATHDFDVPFFTDPAAPPGPSTAPVPPATDRVRVRRWPGRRTLLLGASATALLSALGWATWSATHRPDTRAVVLPETLDGHHRSERLDFAADTSATGWRSSVRDRMGGNAFDGAGYGYDAPGESLLNLIVAREDLSDETDIAMGAAPFTRFGPVRCTSTFDMSEVMSDMAEQAKMPELAAGGPKTSDSMLLCFRTSEHLSVSVLAILIGPVDQADLAAEVGRVWELQG